MALVIAKPRVTALRAESWVLRRNLAVPSNNPFKKIIPLDLFPTDIVSVIDVYKTFNPNIYGDFAGGTFNIATSTSTTWFGTSQACIQASVKTTGH